MGREEKGREGELQVKKIAATQHGTNIPNGNGKIHKSKNLRFLERRETPKANPPGYRL